MRRDFLNHYGDFSVDIPSADTVARVVGLLNPKEFQSAFIDWMKDCHELTKGEVVAVDRKTVIGSYNKAKVIKQSTWSTCLRQRMEFASRNQN